MDCWQHGSQRLPTAVSSSFAGVLIVGIIGGTGRVSRPSSMTTSDASGPPCDDTMEDIVGESVMQLIILPGEGQNQVWLQIPQETLSCATAPQRAAESSMIVQYACADCSRIVLASRLPEKELESVARKITFTGEHDNPIALNSRDDKLRCDVCIMAHWNSSGRKQKLVAFNEALQRGIFDVSWTLTARVTTAGPGHRRELLQHSVQWDGSQSYQDARRKLIEVIHEKVHDSMISTGSLTLAAPPVGEGSA